MREIKFRVWHDEVGEYFYLDFMKLAVSGFGWGEENKVATQLKLSFVNQICVQKPEKARFDVYGENVIIEQFTGLKDKNGKDIYEGDILLFDKEGWDKMQPEVKFGSHLVVADDPFCAGKGWGFYIEYKNRQGETTTDSLNNPVGGFSADSFKIIGNIHENPELLND